MAENKINSPNISTSYIQRVCGGEILSIGTLLVFNQTTVECVAVFYDGTPPQFTPAVILLIQGLTVTAIYCYDSNIKYYFVIIILLLLLLF